MLVKQSQVSYRMSTQPRALSCAFFDVTPNKYIAAIITERGIAKAPYAQSLTELLSIATVPVV